MTSKSARRLLAVCVLLVAAVTAAAAPGVANAGPVSQQCSGASIKGRGSTLQGLAQDNVWNPEFNKSGNKFACSGKQGSKGKPEVKYEQTASADRGSGACLKAFGSGAPKAKYGEYPFCGTDEAPNPEQKGEIETHKEGGAANALETIPVVQGSVAIVVHLPEGCTATSTVEAAPTRLALNDQVVEGIFRGTINTWKALNAASNDGGSKVTCPSETELNDEIVRVVRLDHSGTTNIFKRFLAQASENTKLEEAEWEAETYGTINGELPCGATLPPEKRTWTSTSEGCENQRWPLAAKVVRPAKTGGGEEAAKVATTESSIGYVNLADGRNNGGFTSGDPAKFWAVVQNNFNPKSPTAKAKFSDPATNGDVAAVANSNCAGTKYTNGKEKFPPENTRDSWSEVRAAIKQTKYAICGVTYDLALLEASKWTVELESPAETLTQATTVHDYLNWVLSTEGTGGNGLIKNHDYEKLPGSIDKIAKAGVAELATNGF